MNNLDPGISQRLQLLTREVMTTKSLMERSKSYEEICALKAQLDQQEQQLQAIQNEVRNSWGR